MNVLYLCFAPTKQNQIVSPRDIETDLYIPGHYYLPTSYRRPDEIYSFLAIMEEQIIEVPLVATNSQYYAAEVPAFGNFTFRVVKPIRPLRYSGMNSTIRQDLPLWILVKVNPLRHELAAQKGFYFVGYS